LLLIAAAQGIVSFLFEIPAGILSDTKSRKWAIVTSHAIMGTSMIMTGLVQDFLPIVGTQMLWGISWTFTSGSDVAWITDELNEPKRIPLVLARTARYQFIGSVIGMALFAGFAAIVGRQKAIISAGIIMLILGLLVALIFPERGFKPIHTNRIKAAVSIMKDAIQILMNDRIILLLVIVTIIINGSADTFSRLYPAQIERLGFPTGNDGTIWFGVLGVVSSLAAALALFGVERKVVDQLRAKIAMLLACIFGVVALGILSLAPSLSLAVISILLVNGLSMPISRTVTTIWVNQKCENRVRATIYKKMYFLFKLLTVL
jgi:MFS family permease